MIARRGARAGARYASLIAAPLLGTACGSPQQHAGDATIVRAAAQAQASVAAYERTSAIRRGAVSPGGACGAGLRKVSLPGRRLEGRALFEAPADEGRCAAYR
ncbi:hypothetical protein [Sphingomonas sp. BK580]|uniref:hypothetical protein n=1 Tax=Sphingomonas sp. BK580 TaxID=2586972 RepID=UPI0016089179|nr:hypothetical protein [Sphingomonas sp. BK580]MBB3691570.1 hypothetical protein [Sphingomonas sp. BK580]